MSHVKRKPVLGVFDQVRLKSVCSAKEASLSHEIANIGTRDIILSRQRTTKVLIRLRGCAGWSAPLLVAYGISRFSHDEAQINEYHDPVNWTHTSGKGKRSRSESALFAILTESFGHILRYQNHCPNFRIFTSMILAIPSFKTLQYLL